MEKRITKPDEDSGIENDKLHKAVREYAQLPSHKKIQIWVSLKYSRGFDNTLSSHDNDVVFAKWVKDNNKKSEFLKLFDDDMGDKNNFMQPTQGEDSMRLMQKEIDRLNGLLEQALPTQPSEVKGGVWVKASERLPNKTVVAKHGEYYGQLSPGDDGWSWFGASSIHVAIKSIKSKSITFWLDESLLPSHPDAEKQACEFAEWLGENNYESELDNMLGLVWYDKQQDTTPLYSSQQLYNQYLKTKQ